MRAWAIVMTCGALVVGWGGGSPADAGSTDGAAADATLDAAADGTRPASACIDTAPPSRPGRPALTLRDDGVHLSWDASSDASGVTSYRIFKDGERL
ncbi:MAG: hypothetical protein GXP55_22715, partial [Deltaproteobacteria bacterium]|nr:hypothetical protein [Deltaproteobacteria bacterium]